MTYSKKNMDEEAEDEEDDMVDMGMWTFCKKSYDPLCHYRWELDMDGLSSSLLAARWLTGYHLQPWVRSGMVNC